jgi:hypothetical protein
MKKLCIQAGHQNIKYNTIQALQGSTGAPEEMVNNLRITNRLCEVLRAKGFEVKQTDANANADPQVTDVDWDLYLAIHCDADSALISGGFIDTPDPSVDVSHTESLRIATAMRGEYFKHSGIVERPERMGKSDGVLYYYMWQVLTAKTPCVLIEMGESIDPHDKVILADTERMANAIARGVCAAFGVAFDPVVAPTTPISQPSTPPSTPTTPITPTPQPNPTPTFDYKQALIDIKGVVYGRNYSFYKKEIDKIKAIISKNGI